jgi:glutamate N-acetyltransferase/amino-acid N-acetyltransferase
VDTDTSTSDTVALLANGMAGAIPEADFAEALARISFRMAELVARDGEGATKLLRVRVDGAASDGEARRVAKTVVDSPLVKTMAYGADPNVGRILMAVGKCFDCTIVPERTQASIQGIQVIRNGTSAPFEDSEVRSLLQNDSVEIAISLGVGEGAGVALGCDLTEGYIEENAAYASS